MNAQSHAHGYDCIYNHNYSSEPDMQRANVCGPTRLTPLLFTSRTRLSLHDVRYANIAHTDAEGTSEYVLLEQDTGLEVSTTAEPVSYVMT